MSEKSSDFFGINDESMPPVHHDQLTAPSQAVNNIVSQNFTPRQPRASKSGSSGSAVGKTQTSIPRSLEREPQWPIFSRPTPTIRNSSNDMSQSKAETTLDENHVPETSYSEVQQPDKDFLANRKSVKRHEESKSSAEEFAEKLRKNLHMNLFLNDYGSTKKVDSENMRVPDDLKFRMEYMHADDVVQLLRKLVLVDKHDIIALNKPYGLVCHSSEGSKTISLEKLLPQLQSLMRLPEPLHLVHRLDKDTTGVILLAKTPKCAHELREAFRKQQVFKSYLCITHGVPEPPEGVINIPLKVVKVFEKYKVMLRPKYDSNYEDVMRHYGHSGASEAVTYYQTLDQSGHAALVECRPVTGLTHQIRAHMSQALNTSVLGDHKYSHVEATRPQRLHKDILQKLNIRQSKARYLPLHLHAHCIAVGQHRRSSLPSGYSDAAKLEPYNNRLPSLLVTAPFPEFFLKNLNMLRLRIPAGFSVIKSLLL